MLVHSVGDIIFTRLDEDGKKLLEALLETHAPESDR